MKNILKTPVPETLAGMDLLIKKFLQAQEKSAHIVFYCLLFLLALAVLGLFLFTMVIF